MQVVQFGGDVISSATPSNLDVIDKPLKTMIFNQVSAKRDIRPNDGFLVQLARLHLSLSKK